MTHSRNARFSASQLFWVGIIALVAALGAGWFRTESVLLTVVLALASAVISVAIVWFVDWTRRNG
ncbi:MAG TPA: hypothetical protein VJ975_01575 [Candidatus Limnocylindria bacterium]|nr:hypothetical protein [Candidatus Limnocylindria bacterium]